MNTKADTLLAALDEMKSKIEAMQTKLRLVKLQVKIASDHQHKINILMLKWRSEIDHSTYKLDRVENEVDRFLNTTSEVA
jgi:hypothetical protein